MYGAVRTSFNKNGSETPQEFLNHKLKNKIQLNMVRAHAEAIQNRCT